MTRFLRRPGRWLRRTRFVLAQTRADLGLGLPVSPAWLRDNPFLVKTGRTETRRLGLLLRLGVAVLLLAGLLVGGLWLERAFAGPVSGFLRVVFGMTFPTALFVVLTFVHITLIGSARTAQAVSLADEARRGTLADLLLTPLRRAEMLLAMGVAPARSALLIALVGLPVYLLLGEIGALSARDIVFLYLLFALLSYAPPLYALPALAGGAMTPDTALGKFGLSRARRPAHPGASGLAGAYIVFSLFLVAPIFGLLRGGWLGHLLVALHLQFSPTTSFLLFLAWPFYAMQVLSARLDFFHLTLSPLVYGLPLLACRWAASALQSASALSAGDTDDMARLPVASRARTLARWTARAAGLCALGVVWRAWVESGDTALLAGGGYASPGAGAAGLLLLLGGLSLPGVCTRALAAAVARKDGALRPPLLVLRRAFRRSVRPLGVAGVTFLLACALGGLSPFASPVSQVAGRIALAGAVSVVWAVGLRRLLPAQGLISGSGLLFSVPVAALVTPVPGFSVLAALSPATAWLRLFPDAAGLLTGFRLFYIGEPPSFETCLLGSALVGALGMILRPAVRPSLGTPEARRPSPFGLGRVRPPGLPVTKNESGTAPRHAAWTAALLAWAAARTDNPLFTYELRTRTRSGAWVTWLTLAPVALLAAAVLGLAYPDVVTVLAGMSPFHFFGFTFFAPQPAPGHGWRTVWPDLAALLLTGQCYVLGFRGQIVGEGLIARDRQRGIWGFLLLTPLTAREILWGKVWGQTAPAGAIWAGCSLAGLLLYGLAAPAVGAAPALAAWLIGQVFVAALFVLGLGVGAALSTYPAFSKNGRGLASLLFFAVVGLGLWGQFRLLPLDMPSPGPGGWNLGGWSLLSVRLLLGIGYALALAAPLLGFTQWRVADLRRRDVAVGDGVE